MEIKEFMYEGKVVEFFFGEDVMVNATEMAAVFGRKIGHFLELESTKKWISHLEKTSIRDFKGRESRPYNSGNADLPGEIVAKSRDLTPILITKPGREGSTWMHRLLAIEFAMWLDIEFKLWVILKIDQMLYNYAASKRSNAVRKKELETILKETIHTNYNDPAVRTIAETLNELKEVKRESAAITREFNKDLFE